MARRRTTTTRVTVDRDRGVFMISVAAELADMHPQTLRMYETRGLIEPKRSPKGTRLYSQSDVERLRRIQEMTNELGLNLAGVERVLVLEEQLERATRRLEALERRSREMREEMEAEVERCGGRSGPRSCPTAPRPISSACATSRRPGPAPHPASSRRRGATDGPPAAERRGRRHGRRPDGRGPAGVALPRRRPLEALVALGRRARSSSPRVVLRPAPRRPAPRRPGGRDGAAGGRAG